MFVNPNKSKGFTLIELLVTISILAVLSTIGMLLYQGVLAKTRDATRKNDLNKLASALEIYYQENNNYPNNNSFSNEIAPKLSDNTIPKDPKTGESYYYAGTDTTFTLCATLENPETNNPAPAGCTAGYNYGVVPKRLL